MYYQWRVLKQWCPLCLTVQFCVAAEWLLFYFVYWRPYGIYLRFDPADTFLFITSFCLPIIILIIVKPILSKAHHSGELRLELDKLKRKSLVFESLLREQRQIANDPGELGIVLGNPEASITVIKVCNAFCIPSSKAHAEIGALIDQVPDVKVQIIFTTMQDVLQAQPVKHLLAIAEKGDMQFTLRALHDWYSSPVKNYTSFAVKYPVNTEILPADRKIEVMDDWCRQEGIAFTPTYFLDGYQLPAIYTLADLRQFLSAGYARRN